MLSDRVKVELCAHGVADAIWQNGVVIVAVSPKMPAGLRVHVGIGVRGRRSWMPQVATIETVSDNNEHNDN